MLLDEFYSAAVTVIGDHWCQDDVILVVDINLLFRATPSYLSIFSACDDCAGVTADPDNLLFPITLAVNSNCSFERHNLACKCPARYQELDQVDWIEVMAASSTSVGATLLRQVLR